ncbi:MAG: hypothetical protein AAGJ97_09380 [Planctomycetota bacterium]
MTTAVTPKKKWTTEVNGRLYRIGSRPSVVRQAETIVACKHHSAWVADGISGTIEQIRDEAEFDNELGVGLVNDLIDVGFEYDAFVPHRVEIDHETPWGDVRVAWTLKGNGQATDDVPFCLRYAGEVVP